MLVISLFILLIAQPVLAEDTYDYVYSVSYSELPYGNGQDDDGDGVIDNIEEEDVVFGDFDINETAPLIDGWNSTFNTEYAVEEDLRGNGIAVCPYYDQLWDIESSDNSSVNPTANICYEYNWYMDNHDAIDDYALVTDKMLPAVRFYMNLSAEDIMNGAQEVWYRSPLAYDTTQMDGHVLNIWNTQTGDLIWCNLVNEGVWDANDNPYIRKDNSTVGNASGYHRVYYRLNLNLRTGVRYRVEEYVSMIGDNPTNSIALYMAAFQDVADDGEQATYIFFNTSNARKIPQECAWSILCKFGIGPIGTELPIRATNGSDHITLNSQPIQGTNAINDVKSVEILVPMRCSENMGTVDITLYVLSGGDTDDFSPSDFTNQGGSLMCTFNITDPDPDEINYYELTIDWETFDYPDNVAEDAYATVVMYPSAGDCIVLDESGENTDLQPYFFALHWEISESSTNINIPYQAKTDDSFNWLGLAVILLGVALIIIAPSVGLILMHAGLISSMSIGVGASIGTLALGAYTAVRGFEIMTGHNYINNFLQWAGSGIVRVFSGFIEGVAKIVGGIVKAVVQVIQTIVHYGELLFHYASIILMVIIEMIYLAAFLFVLVMWSLFLTMMRCILHGDFEGAWRTFKKGIKTAREPVDVGIKYGKKIVRAGRGVAGFAATQTHTGAYAAGRLGGFRARRASSISGAREQGYSESYGIGQEYGDLEARDEYRNRRRIYKDMLAMEAEAEANKSRTKDME